MGCQFLGSIFRSLGKLPGGFSRFIPGSLGTHLCRLSHLGWLQCSHGLSCRPLESCIPDCLRPLLDLLGYPANAISALSNGCLRIRYCTHPFAKRFHPWSLGSGECYGQLSHLLTQDGELGHHSRPEEENDRPKVVRWRIRGKTPFHVVWEEWATPTPKRRKWLSLPGPSRGFQDSNHFPRVGVG